jgi:hypothetical protein
MCTVVPPYPYEFATLCNNPNAIHNGTDAVVVKLHMLQHLMMFLSILNSLDDAFEIEYF